MKSLVHHGIYLPSYNLVGLSVAYKKSWTPLNEETEMMAIQFVKKLDTDYVRDPVFVENFLTDFIERVVPPSPGTKYDAGLWILENWNWSDVQEYLAEVKSKTEEMTKEEKKVTVRLKKELREKLKERYGYATVDGEKVPIMNWIAEPACIFLSKGKNPLRGHWKRAITREEIILNLSVKPKDLEEGWKEIIWRPKETWIASWKSPLDNKMKYVWFSPSSPIRQRKEEAKFKLARSLDIEKVKKFIDKELVSKELERRKLATAVYLIMNTGIRVGDEKIAGEHGTIGCTTLRWEHVKWSGNKLTLDFTGKDYVHWHRNLIVPKEVIKNLQEFTIASGGDMIFKGLDSNKVSKFLREVQEGLSAKVFRTYLAGKTFDSTAVENERLLNEETPPYLKTFFFKQINLEVAKKLNHKKTPPKGFDERLERKAKKCEENRVKLQDLGKKLINGGTEKEEKAFEKLKAKTEKLYAEYQTMKETAEWNLSTSLSSYLDPKRIAKFCKDNKVNISSVYSRALQDKFSWALK